MKITNRLSGVLGLALASIPLPVFSAKVAEVPQAERITAIPVTAAPLGSGSLLTSAGSPNLGASLLIAPSLPPSPIVTNPAAEDSATSAASAGPVAAAQVLTGPAQAPQAQLGTGEETSAGQTAAPAQRMNTFKRLAAGISAKVNFGRIADGSTARTELRDAASQGEARILPASVKSATRTPSKREHRIDFLRGVALTFIFVDHMPDNWLSKFTMHSWGFADAAELFVLLAGFAAALAFYPKFKDGKRHEMIKKVLLRVWTLFKSHLAVIIAVAAMFAAVDALNFGTIAGIGINELWQDPLRVFPGLVFLTHQPYYFNILPMYIVLLSLLPAVMWLASHSLRLVLAASVAVYLAAQYIPLSVLSYPAGYGWGFNPLAWQLLFISGFSISVAASRGAPVRFNPWLYGAALAYVVSSFVIVHGGFWQLFQYDWLPNFIHGVDKRNLSLLRLLHILSLAYVVVYSPLWRWLAKLPADNIITRMGRNSLPVFVFGTFLSMGGGLIRVNGGAGLLFDLSIAATGTALMMLLAWFLERRRSVVP